MYKREHEELGIRCRDPTERCRCRRNVSSNVHFGVLVAVAGRSFTMLCVKNERWPLVAVVVCDVGSSDDREAVIASTHLLKAC